jgi:hypothetical protein
MSERAVSESALAEIRKNASSAIQALGEQFDLVSIEAGLLAAASTEEGFDAAEGIQFSEGFSIPELRTLVYSDALALSDLASGMKAGAIGSYLTADQKSDLDILVSKASSIGARVRATGLMSQLPEARRRAAEDHNAMHAQEVLDFTKEAEKAVVTAEAGPGGRVPVLEPYERDEATRKVVIVGVVAVAAAAMIYFS